MTDDTGYDGPEDVWAFDPDAREWWARILLYRPGKLDDEGMRVHFPELDGRWSRQTIDRQVLTGAKGLDLNSSWALTDRRWSCPICQRSKIDLFRLTGSGTLMANLDIHHDHLADAVWPRGFELFGKDWIVTAPSGTGAQLDLVEALVRRFRPTLVCQDCNAADGTAKNGIPGIDRRFSFAPAEIASFISPRPGQPHIVDTGVAGDIWLQQGSRLERRVTLVDELLHSIGAGALETVDSVGTALLLDRFVSPLDALWLTFCRQNPHDERRQVLQNLHAEFLARSTSKDSPGLAGKGRRPPVSIRDDEYAGYVDPVSRKLWEKTPEDWRCPCCARYKREIVRKGKTGKWGGGVRNWRDYVIETDGSEIQNRRLLFPDLANRVFLRDVVPVDLCSDCANVPAHIGHRFPDVSQCHFNVSDIREALLAVVPHGQHEVDWERGRQIAEANRSLVSAASARDALIGQASKFQAWLSQGKRSGWSADEIRQRIRDDLQYQVRPADRHAMDRLIGWLLDLPIDR